ncbi:hypothetical protein Pan44_49430 [Caulifigura coniformis]|uniref:Uncharacterized protein n=1 Tax=Caulifigura coniformis TaxID=2527983 RepID=A0A517SL91_9PLAN|nr:hypothetical protein [Caulifigura coniformis]QDT56882.1 hypothetical protein Pan44_49430 [Caulifigura coniformis]
MDMPQLTPQRQKMLMGAAAAGLLLLLGFSYAPSLEVADDGVNSEVDEVLALVEVDRARPQLRDDEQAAPRPFRRFRSQAPDPQAATPEVEIPVERPKPLAMSRSSVESSAKRVVPPSYQQRMQLLAEEEAILARHQLRRHADASTLDIDPVPTITAAAAESTEELSTEVEHALGEARRPDRWRRVELVQGTGAAETGDTGAPRGAWLSGSIEIE